MIVLVLAAQGESAGFSARNILKSQFLRRIVPRPFLPVSNSHHELREENELALNAN